MGSKSWIVPQPWHGAPAVDAGSFRARACATTTALWCAQLLPILCYEINVLRDQELCLLSVFEQPCSVLETSPGRVCSRAELSEPARAASPIPLYFNLGKCHCALVLGSDICDPVKHGAISIGTAHAEGRGPVVLNVTLGEQVLHYLSV